jgi:NitT/TauT family transport system permease protein
LLATEAAAMRLMNIKPGRGSFALLALLPFLLVAILYLVVSVERRAANPNDKLLPGPAQMLQSFAELATVPDKRTGGYVLWSDTLASLERLGIALGGACLIGLVLALIIGVVPLARALLLPFINVISLVPPLALLPILFIALGLGDLSKIVLIMIGITPVMIRDLVLRVAELPREQVVKAQTLGASSWQFALRIVLPQMAPRLIDAVRLALGPAWLFLISAEAIAADGGLGYRIFLVRRFFAMDVIIPYVIWITLIAFLMDRLLLLVQRRAFPWFAEARAA